MQCLALQRVCRGPSKRPITLVLVSYAAIWADVLRRGIIRALCTTSIEDGVKDAKRATNAASEEGKRLIAVGVCHGRSLAPLTFTINELSEKSGAFEQTAAEIKGQDEFAHGAYG